MKSLITAVVAVTVASATALANPAVDRRADQAAKATNGVAPAIDKVFGLGQKAKAAFDSNTIGLFQEKDELTFGFQVGYSVVEVTTSWFVLRKAGKGVSRLLYALGDTLVKPSYKMLDAQVATARANVEAAQAAVDEQRIKMENAARTKTENAFRRFTLTEEYKKLMAKARSGAELNSLEKSKISMPDWRKSIAEYKEISEKIRNGIKLNSAEKAITQTREYRVVVDAARAEGQALAKLGVAKVELSRSLTVRMEAVKRFDGRSFTMRTVQKTGSKVGRVLNGLGHVARYGGQVFMIAEIGGRTYVYNVLDRDPGLSPVVLVLDAGIDTASDIISSNAEKIANDLDQKQRELKQSIGDKLDKEINGFKNARNGQQQAASGEKGSKAEQAAAKQAEAQDRAAEAQAQAEQAAAQAQQEERTWGELAAMILQKLDEDFEHTVVTVNDIEEDDED